MEIGANIYRSVLLSRLRLNITIVSNPAYKSHIFEVVYAPAVLIISSPSGHVGTKPTFNCMPPCLRLA
jgi:hypothetical protein